MASVQKIPFSFSGTGLGIRVVETISWGTTIHGTTASSSVIDEVWLWAINSDTTDRKVTVLCGSLSEGAPEQNDVIEVTIPFESGPILIVPGLALTGHGTGAQYVRVFASEANVIVVNGFVNRINP